MACGHVGDRSSETANFISECGEIERMGPVAGVSPIVLNSALLS